MCTTKMMHLRATRKNNAVPVHKLAVRVCGGACCCPLSPNDATYQCMLRIRTTTNAVRVHQLAVDKGGNMFRCIFRRRCRRAGTCPSSLKNKKRSILIAMCIGALLVASAGVLAPASCPSIHMYHAMVDICTSKKLGLCTC